MNEWLQEHTDEWLGIHWVWYVVAGGIILWVAWQALKEIARSSEDRKS